jgi:predicted ABC-type ATPase
VSARTPPAAALRRQLEADGPFIIVVAGSNGAGKSTFVDRYVRPAGLRIINPDDVARGLAAVSPDAVAYEAAEIAAVLRQRLVAEGRSFCMETVLSDPVGEKPRFLREAQRAGYVIFLVFIGLESAQLSIARVMQRVDEGGHDVPDEKLVARYPRTLANLERTLAFADHALLFDNSSADAPYRFVAEFVSGRLAQRSRHRPRWAVAIVR